MESIETPTEETQEMNLPEIAAYAAENGYALIVLPPDALSHTRKVPTLILPPAVTARLLARQEREAQGLAAFARKVRAEGLAVFISDTPDVPNQTRLNYTWEGFFREVGAESEAAARLDSEDRNLLETLRLCCFHGRDVLIHYADVEGTLPVIINDGNEPITDAALQSLRRLLEETPC